MSDTPIGDELADKILGTPADEAPVADHISLLDGEVREVEVDPSAPDPGAYEEEADEDPAPALNDDADDNLDDVPEGTDDGDTDLDDDAGEEVANG